MLQERKEEKNPITTVLPEKPAPTSNGSLKGMSFEQGTAALKPGGPVQMKTDPMNKYGITGDEGVKATGVGMGNRPGDVPDKEKGEVGNSKVEATSMGDIPAPDLTLVPTLHEKKTGAADGEGKSGVYTSTTVKGGAGGKVNKGISVVGKEDADPSKVGKALSGGDYLGAGQGLVKVKGPGMEGAAGYSANATVGVKGQKEGKYGKVEGDLSAQADAYVGAQGKMGLSEKGAAIEGTAGAGVSAGVKGEAAYTTPGIAIDGVEKPLTAGAKVEGNAEVYAKAGVTGGAYLTKDMIGVKGSAKAGAGAKAEAKGTVHMGPVSVTGKVSGIAGAEASAEGSFYYADGKIHVGGSLSAALGLGGEVGVEVVIDVKQSWELAKKAVLKAKELGIKGYQAVFNALDHDGDGQLSLNDFANHGADAMRGGAKMVDKGVDGIISALDRDGDGKFSLQKDGAAAMGQAYDYAKEKVGQAKEKVGEGVDWVKDKANKAGKAVHQALDQDGNGKLGANDVVVGAQKIANKTVDLGKKAWSGAKTVWNKGVGVVKNGWNTAKQWAGKAKEVVDRNGDGHLDWKDVVEGAREIKQSMKSGAEWAGDKAKQGWSWLSGNAGKAWGWLKGKGQGALDAVHGFLDANNDGKLSLADARQGIQNAAQWGQEKASQVWQSITDTYHSTVQSAQEAYQAAKAKLDVNADGKIDREDLKAAARLAREQLKETYHNAVAKAKEVYEDAKATVKNAIEKAKEMGQELKQKLDADGDGKLGFNDLKVGAQNAWNRTKQKASEVKEAVTKTWNSATETVSEAWGTLKTGFNDAKSTVKSAWGKLTSFFGG